MCGIGGILRIHKPGSPEAERLNARLGGTPTDPGGMPTRYSARACERATAPPWELFHQPCRNGAPTAAPIDAGPRPYGTGTAAGAWTIEESWLDTLEDSVKHRGPDGRGRFRDAALRPDGSVVEVALIHRRLSIIDHEGGAQPMVNQGGPALRAGILEASGPTNPNHGSESRATRNGLIAVLFNGCIYNHRELRKDLEARGHVFQTDHSDTEVLIHGWREWGEDITQHLSGMYAAVIWDRTSLTLWGRRDPFGKKPLYRFETESGSLKVFGSSAAGVVKTLARMGRRSSLDEWNTTSDWIQLGFSWADYLPYDRIRVELPAPTVVTTVDTTGLEDLPADVLSAASWSLQDFEDIDQQPPIDSIDRLSDVLHEAVRRRLEADVPIGCLLSGGVDSSAVAKCAMDERGEIRTFCVRMPDRRYDESRFAEHVARRLGTHHETVEAHADPANDLVRLIEQIGLPFGDSSLLPTYWACAAARQHVPVLLTGDGADELFYGYERYAGAELLFRWGSVLRILPRTFLRNAPPKSRMAKLYRLITAARGAGYAQLLAIFQHPDLRRCVLAESRNAGTAPQDVDAVRVWDLDVYLPYDLMRKADTASMSVALELRCPFLDRDLVAVARETPREVLMPNGQRKGLLRNYVRTFLPPEIVDRPKMGFAIPIGEWFRSDYGGMRQLLYDHLNSTEPFGPPSLGIETMINMHFVRQMLREHDQAGEGRGGFPWRGRDHSQRLYMLLVLSIWAKWLGRL